MRIVASALIVLLFAGLVSLVIWLLAIRPRRPITDTVVTLLQLVAVYTFIVAFLSKAGIFAQLGSLERDLASPDPLVFLSANFIVLAILFGGLGVALDPATTASAQRFLLGLPVLIVCGLLLVAYTFIHLLAIVPLAYFGHVITSVPIDALLGAGSDLEVQVGSEKLRIGQTVKRNEVALRHFLVSLPAFVLSQAIKVAPLLRRRPPSAGVPS